MSKQIENDLDKMLHEGAISTETAEKIKAYYHHREGVNQPPNHRLLFSFGVLGAILVGLGVILILADNWEYLSRAVQTIVAFLPVTIGILLCLFVVFRRTDSAVWREGSAVFLFFAIAACMSMLTGTYELKWESYNYLLTWLLLGLPLIYAMRSAVVSLLIILNATVYVSDYGYFSGHSGAFFYFLLLMLLAFPHYYRLAKEKPESNLLFLHHWLIPFAVIIALGTVADKAVELLMLAYVTLFGLMIQIGDTDYFANRKLRYNGYGVLGIAGTIVLLMGLTFSEFWIELANNRMVFINVLQSPEIYVILILFAAAGTLFYRRLNVNPLPPFSPLALGFVVMLLLYVLGFIWWIFPVVIINFYLFIAAVFIIVEGARKDRLDKLNLGMVIMMVWILCRFFDLDVNNAVRGILFLMMGFGFFLVNHLIFARRRRESKHSDNSEEN